MITPKAVHYLQMNKNKELITREDIQMKRHVFVFIMMLLAISFANADGNPAEAAEHWEKVRQMDQLAEIFKAETGFTGNVDYWLERMKLQSYEGKFSDIPFSAGADTTAFRQACIRILDKILPYSYAKRSQLSMSRISSRTGYISTDYYQIVNGYRVEGSGFIVITYDVGRYRFDIGDNAVELPEENVETIISEEEAEKIALINKNDSRYQKAWVKSVFYSNMGSDTYFLAYLTIVSDETNPLFGDYTYYINAFNGKVMLYRPVKYIH